MVCLSIVLAILAWVKLYYAKDRLVLRLLAAPLPLLPILGPLAIFWIFNMPPRQPIHLRQNRWNHYGRTEFGSNDNAYSDNVKMTRAERREKERAEKRAQRRKKNPKSKVRISERIDISLIIIIGFSAINIMLYGLIAMRDGGGSYTNWWGGSVYGPAAIIVGILLIVLIIKRHDESS